jgi:hypothetical protein
VHFVVEYFYTYVHACDPTLLANETDPPHHLFYAHMIGFQKEKNCAWEWGHAKNACTVEKENNAKLVKGEASQ